MANPTYTYAARLKKISDGDTVHLDIDLGFTAHVTVRIRLKGINCPETDAPGGTEATAFTRDWFAQHGDQCVVTTHDAHKLLDAPPKEDVYARWIGIIAPLGVDEDSLNDALIASGHAVIDTYPKR